MTDYYPLIARAVSGLEKNTGEARRGLYERARTALVAQLRGLTPALTELEITRERLGLEEAIRKVEAESARRTPRVEAVPRSGDQAARSSDPAAKPGGSRPLPGAKASEAPPRDGAPQTAAKPAPAAVRREAPAAPAAAETKQADGPLSEPGSPRNSGRGRFDDRSPLSDQGLKGFRDVVAEAETLGEATSQAGRTARQAFAAMPGDNPEFDRLEPRVEPQGLRSPSREAAPRPREPVNRAPEAPRSLDPPRPEPPVRPEPPRMEAFGLEPPRMEAYRLEPPRPEPPRPEPARPEPPPRSAEARAKQRGTPTRHVPVLDDDQEEQPRRSAKGLIAAVVAVLVLVGLGVAVYWQRVPLKNFFTAMRGQPSQTEQRGITTPSQPKSTDRVGQPSPSSNQGPIAAVAQRVVLYEEDPTDAQGKRYLGSVIWRTELVAPGTGANQELAVRADLEIPERRITMTMSIRRNTDQALPASHTVEIMFNLPADFPFGGVSNVPGILMKQAEQTRGAPLAGLAVKVTSGFFLVGLSAVDSEMQRNLELLKERSWFDVPIVYNNGRRAILAIEKGTPGERAFADAFATWGK